MASVTKLNSWQRGFTMVELLVVLAIAGILLTLVGPFTVNQLDNVKRAQEREEIRLLLNQWQFQAFQQRRAFHIRFTGHDIHLYGLDSFKYDSRQPAAEEGTSTTNESLNQSLSHSLSHSTFEYSEFPQQSIEINAHGFVTPIQVRVRQGEREFTLSLENLGFTASHQRGQPHAHP